jgi:spermidine/putrescine transport system permease protein
MVIAIYSFNDSPIMSWPLKGFTFGWYEEAIHNKELIDGLKTSLIVAVVSTGAAVLMGLPAAIALDRFVVRGRDAFTRILVAPFLFPGVITGVALASLFINVGIELSLTTVIIGHTSMILGVVVILTVISLNRWDRNLEQAAMDLGASPVRAFWTVTLPNLRAAIGGAVLLGITVSLDEATRTFFLVGTENTLPMVIQSMMRLQITPEVNAIASIVLFVSLLSLVGMTLILSRSLRNKE